MYEDKPESYYSHVRDALIAWVATNPNNKILDVGCGNGETGRRLKEIGKAGEVVGIELYEEAAKQAVKKLDKVLVGDVEKMQLSFPAGYFDYLLLDDLIEHLVDPWNTMKKLVRFLKKGGIVIASIPNVRYWRVTKDLLLYGKWDYCEEGILDKTHLRFFTRKSIDALFRDVGLSIEIFSYEKILGKSRIFDLLTAGLFRDHLIRQFLIRARKKQDKSL